MPTFTTNYQFNLPLVNDPTDEDQWGGLLNENFTDLDTIVKAVSNATYEMVAAKSSNYAILASDRNYLLTMDATVAPRSFTLPSPASVGNGYRVAVKKIDSSSNAVTVVGTVEGGSVTLSGQYDFFVFVTDGTSWFKVSGVSFATLAEINTGTVTNKAVAPSALFSAYRFKKTFVSAQQTITNGGQIILPHALGVYPKILTSYLVCTTANIGYLVDDKVIYPLSFSYDPSNPSGGCSCVIDDTNITVRFGVSGQTLIRKDTGVRDTITNASWRLVIEAWG